MEPRSRPLLHTADLGIAGDICLTELQQLISRKTGLSIISDYFTDDELVPEWQVDADADVWGQPLWRALNLLCEADAPAGPIVIWEDLGGCLVFHWRAWHRKQMREIPERLLEGWRTRFASQDTLTLDDLVSVARELAQLPSPNVDFDVPADLWRRNLDVAASAVNRCGLLAYGSLSSEQLALALTKEGLSYSQMTRAQRDLVEKVLRRAPSLLDPEMYPQDPEPQSVQVGRSRLQVTVMRELLDGRRVVTLCVWVRAPGSGELAAFYLPPEAVPPVLLAAAPEDEGEGDQ
jgi:hypothetical protein